MKITNLRITASTALGGWADELKPVDDVHTIVEVIADGVIQ